MFQYTLQQRKKPLPFVDVLKPMDKLTLTIQEKKREKLKLQHSGSLRYYKIFV
jgi:hypothetical protein